MATYDVEDWTSESQVPPAGTLTPSDVTVGTSAVQLSPVTSQLAIALLADPANTGTIYVATTAAVSSSSWPLAAGSFYAIGADVSLWVIGSAVGQVLHVMQAGV